MWRALPLLWLSPQRTAIGQLAFDIPGKAIPSGQEHYGPEQWRTVSPHFFKVFRIPLLSGRVFTEHDDMGGAPVVIVSAAFARKYFANENPIGRTLDIGKGIGPIYADYARREIVGVVGDTCETGLVGGKVPVMYIPQAQQPQGMTKIFNSSVPLAWEVRSSLDEKPLISAVAKAIHEVDGRLPLGEVRPMDKILADSISRQNFNMLLLSIFATLGSAARRDWYLRRNVLLGPATNQGHRSSHGSWSRQKHDTRDDPTAGAHACVHRRGRGPCRSFGFDETYGKSALWSEIGGPRHLLRCSRNSIDSRAPRSSLSGAARHFLRSYRGPSQRLMVEKTAAAVATGS